MRTAAACRWLSKEKEHVSPSINGPSVLRFVVCGRWRFRRTGIQAESSSAVKPAWEHVGPGLAGVMAPVAADPIGRGTIYIATMAGGVRRSLDNGETWATVNNGLATLATSALAVDAAGPQTVYVGTVGGGAYKSDDGGESWRALAGGIQGLIVHPLVADPIHPGVVYTGTLGGSMRKTVDGGNTWPVVFTGTQRHLRHRDRPQPLRSRLFRNGRSRRVQEQQCRRFVDRDVHSHATCDLDGRGRSGG